MNIMDKHLLEHPTEGVKSMVDLLKTKGYPVGPKRIRSVSSPKIQTGYNLEKTIKFNQYEKIKIYRNTDC